MTVSIHGLRCQGCLYQAVFTSEDSEVGPLLAMVQDLVCPKCGRANISFALERARVEERLTPTQMRQAFTGLGLPDEQKVSPELIKELFTEVGVKSVETADSPAKRVLIRSFTFNDERVVYLGPSGFGVAAFKVTRGE